VWVLAAEAATEPDSTLITVAFGFLGTVVMTLGTIIVAGMKIKHDRADRVDPSPPAADTRTGERVAVLEHMAQQGQKRDDDSDTRDDLQDRAIYSHDERLERHHRRLERLESWADRTDPGWRSP
jgi:hypothetical protein